MPIHGRATLTIVASMPAIPLPRIIASRTQRPWAERYRMGSALAAGAGGMPYPTR